MKLVETHFLGEDFIPASRKEICCPVETVSFYSVLFPCSWKPLVTLVETSSLYFL